MLELRRATALPIGESGCRPGHPDPERRVLTVAQASAPERLNVSSTIVRGMVESGELDGFWVLKGKVYRWYVYEDAVERFIDQCGRYPAARWSSGRQAAGSGRSAERILELEHTVRKQSEALDHLHTAFKKQEEAILHLLHANKAVRKAAKNMRKAVAAYGEIARTQGVPSYPPSC